MTICIGILAACALLASTAAGSEAPTNDIRIDLHDEQQVIHSFGASDAWTCQFVGEHWPIEKRKRIADLLFSLEVDGNGNPRGIGLSMWRFNVGAGSAEQGDASRISSPWHRAECFLNADGYYDWQKQKGQQWFLRAARERGVPFVLGFANSPPVHLTLNGIAHSSNSRWTMNIREDALPAFADFLAGVAEHFWAEGLNIDYISPVNEPQYIWDSPKQEGTPATNQEIAELTRLISNRLHERGIPCKVVVPEAARYDYLWWKEGNPREAQAVAFWSPSSPTFLGHLPAVAHAISAHSYFTTWPLAEQVRVREELRRYMREIDPGLAFWQTEFCILESSDEIAHGHGRDLGMDTALYVARVIHSDLTIANASHWSWWLAISHADYKDGLVYIEGEAPETDGRVLPSKTLWALGNFSRFVRPGMVRVGVSCDDGRSVLEAASSLMVSAYTDRKTGALVIVAINCTNQAQAIRIANLGKGFAIRGSRFASYTTSQTKSLRKSSMPADRIVIPPRAVVTLVGRVQNAAS